MIEFEEDELHCLIDDINCFLPQNYRIKFVKASIVTEDNSNLYQSAQIMENEMRSSEEWWSFDKFLWISKKPHGYGIALYYKI
jgi:glutathione peroxidase-family protein